MKSPFHTFYTRGFREFLYKTIKKTLSYFSKGKENLNKTDDPSTDFFNLVVNKNPFASLITKLKQIVKKVIDSADLSNLYLAVPDINKSKWKFSNKKAFEKLEEYASKLKSKVVVIDELGRNNSPHKNILFNLPNPKSFSRRWNYGRVHLVKVKVIDWDGLIEYIFKELIEPGDFIKKVHFAPDKQKAYLKEVRKIIKNLKVKSSRKEYLSEYYLNHKNEISEKKRTSYTLNKDEINRRRRAKYLLKKNVDDET